MTEKKVALVTDATHFVGRPSLRALLDQGWTCFAADDDFADEATRKDFAAELPGVTCLNETDPAAMVAAVVDQAGGLDCLVSNDAYPADKTPLLSTNPADLGAKMEEAVGRLMVRPYALAAAAAQQMAKAGGGHIIFVSSAAPLQGLVNYSVYASARGATNALVRSLALELGPSGISVNALAPNFVESPTYFPQQLLDNPEHYKKITSRIPLRRLAKPEEAGKTIAFLASKDAGFITGQVLAFSGGWA